MQVLHRQRVFVYTHPEILRYEEIIRIVRIAASLGRKIRLTGGEPLREKISLSFSKRSTPSGA